MTAITTAQLDELERKARTLLDACESSIESDSPSAHAAVAQASDEMGEVTSVSVTLRLVAVARAALAWSEARDEWQLRQTFSCRSRLDEVGDALQAALRGTP